MLAYEAARFHEMESENRALRQRIDRLVKPFRHHPAVVGVVSLLPSADQPFPKERQIEWLRMFEGMCQFVFQCGGRLEFSLCDGEIEVSVTEVAGAPSAASEP